MCGIKEGACYVAADYSRQLQASPELPYQLQKIDPWRYAVPRAGSHKAFLEYTLQQSIAEHSKLYPSSQRVNFSSDGVIHV